MAKKLKDIAAKSAGDNQLIQTVRDSAQQIWMAGVGAFAKAQAEGGKVYEALVKEGEGLSKKTRKLAEARFAGMSGNVSKTANEWSNKAQSSATEAWDKLEQVFEDRVARALNRLGVPTAREVASLTKQVETLTASVNRLSGKPAPRTAAAAAKKPAAKRAVKKVVRK
jgi:poly(hydroxyalkanoate) granule-associated protein